MPAVLLLAASVLVTLGGCTATVGSPTVDAGSPSRSALSGTAPTQTVPAPADTAPADTAHSAQAGVELARFDAVNRRTVERVHDPGGRDFIDALLADGFRRADMQVTEDRTTIGLPVPSVQFSVLWHGVCLIGQHGPGSVGYRSEAVEPVDGRCLIGTTRPIDW